MIIIVRSVRIPRDVTCIVVGRDDSDDLCTTVILFCLYVVAAPFGRPFFFFFMQYSVISKTRENNIYPVIYVFVCRRAVRPGAADGCCAGFMTCGNKRIRNNKYRVAAAAVVLMGQCIIFKYAQTLSGKNENGRYKTLKKIHIRIINQ